MLFTSGTHPFKSCFSNSAISKLRPEALFIAIAVPLQILYLALFNPLQDYHHGTERYLHVAYLAHTFTGGEINTLPLGFIELSSAAGRLHHVRPLIPEQDFIEIKKKYPKPSKKRPKRMPWDFWHISSETNLVTFHTSPNPGAYSPISYIPQLAIAVPGVLIGLSPLIILLLQQAVTAAVSILLGYYTIRTSPILKWHLATLLLLPTLFIHRSAIMPDALTIGLSLYFIAKVLGMREQATLGKKELSLLSGLAFLIGQCKSIYIGIIALFWVVPTKFFRSVFRKIILIILLAGVGIASSLSWSTYTLATYGQTEHYSWNTSTVEKRVLNILKEPIGQIDRLLKRSVLDKEKYEVWIHNQIHWWGIRAVKIRDANINLSFYFLWLLSVVFSLPYDKRISFRLWERLWAVSIFIGMIITIILVVYLTSTKDAITPNNGRYFLPVMPLLWIAFYNLWPTRTKITAIIPVLLLGIVLYSNFLMLDYLSVFENRR